MKTIRYFFLTLISLSLFILLTACQSSKTEASDLQTNRPVSDIQTSNQPLDDTQMVIYFSATQNTASIADMIAKQAHIPLYQIIPQDEYTTNDLDWHDQHSRANQEQRNPAVRPAIKNALPDLSHVSTVYLGFPLWWGHAPKIIQTFIEQSHLEGKTIYVFCTSGSSPIVPAVEELKQLYPNLNWTGMKRFETDASPQEIHQWINHQK